MPWWKKDEINHDCNGCVIKHGDVLKHLDPNNPEQYFYCCNDKHFDIVELRDLNNYNVGMADFKDLEIVGTYHDFPEFELREEIEENL